MHSNNKGEGLTVRGRTFGTEGINSRNSHSMSRGCKSNKFYKYWKKKVHLFDECHSLENKKEKEEMNKQSQKSIEASIVDSETDGDALCLATTNHRCAIE